MSRPPRPTGYLRRHRGRLEEELEPGEQLLAASRVAFFGARSATSSPRVPGEPALLVRSAAYTRWAAQVADTGFPTAGPDFVLAVTDRRWVVWRTSKWWNLPVRVAGSILMERIHEVTLQRLLISGVLTLRFRDGGQVMVEAPFVTRLRPLVAAHEQAAG